ncbi:MAG: MFS transporter [Anaerolineales bacterium]|nr:MFS transporter [Anaerolineales bacterium]
MSVAPHPHKFRTFSSLRHRNFQLYIGGQLVSLAGTWMQNVAQGWLVYQISGSEATLGIVGFAAAIPALVVTPWAGVVVDRVHKRKLLVVTQTVSMLLAFILSALTFLNVVEVWQVVLLAIGLGIVNAFDGPARQAFVVEMVGREDLPNAIALNSMTFNAARVVGPAIGGVLLATVGAGWCFFINGLSFLAVIVSLLLMQISHEPSYKGTQSPWTQLKSGVRYTATQPELRALIILALFFSTFGISYMTMMPAFVDRVLNVGAAGYGMLTAAMGAGAVTGAFVVATYGDRGYRGRWLFGAAMIFPFVLAAFALNQNYPVAILLAYLLGIGFMLQFTLINTLLQTRVADAMRGRVMSLYTLTFFGFAPFGNLALGALSESIGLSPAILIAAAITLFSSIAIFLWTPQLRRLP